MARPGVFARFAHHVSEWVGKPGAFTAAMVAVLIWALLGPATHYSDTWQLTINTATTIVTFLMVFIIQNTQNRQDAAIQIKLDELLRAVVGAHSALVDLEEVSDEELTAMQQRYRRLAERLREASAESDTGTPPV
jgi:low affinity Fe/Cu permease